MADASRGKGIGSFLMNCLKEAAAYGKMKKVMLTVFRSNEPAVAFYHANGYVLLPFPGARTALR